jgi:hypothetical protein
MVSTLFESEREQAVSSAMTLRRRKRTNRQCIKTS